MAEVTLEGVTKIFPGGTVAVDHVDLEIADGELLVLVGPSGSGKTTVLRLTAGLEELNEGEIRIGDRVVNNLHPMDRDIAMVFQSYALYPHMTVAENIGFGLKLRRTPKREVRERVEQTAAKLALTDLLKRKPAALSGGQRQRVAMGRAIVRDPAAFLMDEPLSNLDAKLRVQMRAEIQRLQNDLGTTTMYVTHDQVEAMTMGDRVAVMRDGRLIQVDTPQALYTHPADLFVAGFIGSPAMNFVRARLEGSNGSLVASFGSTRLELATRMLPPSVAGRTGGDVIVGLRPEHLEIASGDDGRPVLRAPVALAEPVGSQTIVHLDLDCASVGDSDFCACLSSQSPCDRGEMITLAVDPATLHFFDPETEIALKLSRARLRELRGRKPGGGAFLRLLRRCPGRDRTGARGAQGRDGALLRRHRLDALGERIDPESLRRVMARYFETAKAIVERHGGTVEKFIGDAVMAVFGVPAVHEDDALRAVRAAEELRGGLGELNEELERDYGTRLELRMGVNTGEVVTGTEERLATGDAVNVAARLEQAAQPGEVLLGEETYRPRARRRRRRGGAAAGREGQGGAAHGVPARLRAGRGARAPPRARR